MARVHKGSFLPSYNKGMGILMQSEKKELVAFGGACVSWCGVWFNGKAGFVKLPPLAQ